MESNLKALLLAIVIVTGLSSVSAYAKTVTTVSVTVEDVAHSTYWKRLLHYRFDILGRERSEVDDPGFFLSSDGRQNPLSELRATIEAFRRPVETKIGRYEQHPQCVFPERFRFLSEILSLETPKIDCAEFNKWKSGLKVREVALVYAAPYLGNPASMFGHTFLRLKLHDNSDLLDAGLSFDADPTQDSALLFAYRGLTGGYPGRFSIQPYYLKIKAYSQVENRDLWEFDLKLSEEQIERLVAHIWEMGSTYLDYYFFDENCSYQLLSLLEVGDPKSDLLSRFRFKTVPLDTVRAVEDAGLLGQVHTRRAFVTQLERRIQGLSKEDRASFQEILEGTRGLRGGESLELLEALLDWQHHQSSNRMEGGRVFSSELEQQILLARASMGASPNSVVAKGDAQLEAGVPQKGHRTSKFALGYGRSGALDRETGFLGVMYRPVLHDRLDRDLGYIPFSTLELARLDLRYWHAAGRLALESFTIAKVENLNAWSKLKRSWSWVAGLEIARPRDLDCLDCVAGAANYGFGSGHRLFSDSDLAVALVKLRAEYSNSFLAAFDQAHRLSPSFEALYMLPLLSSSSGFHAVGELRAEHAQLWSRLQGPAKSVTEFSATFAASRAPMELRLKATINKTADRQTGEWSLGLGSYF